MLQPSPWPMPSSPATMLNPERGGGGMKKRSKAAIKKAKARPRKALKPKRRSALKALSRPVAAPARETEVARLTRERDEALEQQAAISDVLRVVSNSPTDVQPVLDAVARHAARICEAQIVDISIVANQVSRIAASFGRLGRQSSLESLPLDRSTVTGRSICDLKAIHVADMQNANDEFPLGRELAIKFGHRTILSVPLIREDRALGAILVRRIEVRPFEDKHITLLKAFADQAAIATGNVRLFKAEQQRTRELTESLEQQTATSEVLRVISSSPGELEPVFNAMLESAISLCDAKFGNLYLYDGEEFRTAAVHSASSALVDARPSGVVVRHTHPAVPLTRLTRTKEVMHIADVRAEPSYIERDPSFTEFVDISGARTFLIVPMLKEDVLVGAIAIYRQEVRPFTDKQIALVQNFAAQAVIAIENTRLLNELRESLQEQTAASQVLQIISSSPGELQPVFEAMLENATRICEASSAFFIFTTTRALNRRPYRMLRQSTVTSSGREVSFSHRRATVLTAYCTRKQ